MKKIEPLTASERLYAEKHHDLVYHFLSHYKLKEDEYYDIIIFGYLAAIQEYLRNPKLQCYQFSTIAWRQMYLAYLEHLIYQNRSKRKALTITYQEDSPIEELNRLLPNRIDALVDRLCLQRGDNPSYIREFLTRPSLLLFASDSGKPPEELFYQISDSGLKVSLYPAHSPEKIKAVEAWCQKQDIFYEYI